MGARLRLVDDPGDGGALPRWAVRLEELSERELRLLSYGVGDRLPHEVVVNLERLRAERARLLADSEAFPDEVPGRWVGEGARSLGLSGVVDVEQLKAMMDGQDAGSGEQLAVRGPRSATSALDLTFSAPKSVSVLFAVGDEQLSGALVAAHEEAVVALRTANLPGSSCAAPTSIEATSGLPSEVNPVPVMTTRWRPEVDPMAGVTAVTTGRLGWLARLHRS